MHLFVCNSYDDNGNQLTVDTNGAIDTYTYNEKDRLISVNKADGTVLEFGYDLDEIRVRKTVNSVTTDYAVDSNRDYAQVLLETTNNTQTRYSYGLDLLNQTQANETHFYHYDAQGTTKSLSDEQNAVRRIKFYRRVCLAKRKPPYFRFTINAVYT